MICTELCKKPLKKQIRFENFLRGIGNQTKKINLHDDYGVELENDSVLSYARYRKIWPAERSALAGGFLRRPRLK